MLIWICIYTTCVVIKYWSCGWVGQRSKADHFYQNIPPPAQLQKRSLSSSGEIGSVGGSEKEARNKAGYITGTKGVSFFHSLHTCVGGRPGVKASPRSQDARPQSYHSSGTTRDFPALYINLLLGLLKPPFKLPSGLVEASL
jgi:hypothetical protein